jgi:hypothetical protein
MLLNLKILQRALGGVIIRSSGRRSRPARRS